MYTRPTQYLAPHPHVYKTNPTHSHKYLHLYQTHPSPSQHHLHVNQTHPTPIHFMYTRSTQHLANTTYHLSKSLLTPIHLYVNQTHPVLPTSSIPVLPTPFLTYTSAPTPHTPFRPNQIVHHHTSSPQPCVLDPSNSTYTRHTYHHLSHTHPMPSIPDTPYTTYNVYKRPILHHLYQILSHFRLYPTH